MQILSQFLLGLDVLVASLLMIYSLNCYIMIYLFHRRYRSKKRSIAEFYEAFGDLLDGREVPIVTTQIPVFNEMNVVCRAMDAACAIEYPKGRHEIQVLDDSNDETVQLIDEHANKLRDLGHDIVVIRRENRQGFKAGALAEGLKQAKGSLVAVFDADFVPEQNFLRKTVPFFLERPRLGLIQARWGHLNDKQSLLTRVQSLGIDGHFMVEQSARSWNGLFMNFNGTAGLWRVQAIEESGGWSAETLTEDMDLSYRVQLKGWEAEYLQDLVVPAEIPEDVGAFKSQQFRWAKGATQTAIKIMPLLWQQKQGFFKTLQAFLHMTRYLVHPLMLLTALLALPLHFLMEVGWSTRFYTSLSFILALSVLAPNAMYLISQRFAYRGDWLKRILYVPSVMVIGVGLAVSNTKAVLEALLGVDSPFVRTPKQGEASLKTYKQKIPWLVLLELCIGLYCALTLRVYLDQGLWLVGPFLAIYTSGFLFIGMLTLIHGMGYHVIWTKRVEG